MKSLMLEKQERRRSKEIFLSMWILFCFHCGFFVCVCFVVAFGFAHLIAYFVLFSFMGAMAGTRGGQKGLRGEQNWGA